MQNQYSVQETSVEQSQQQQVPQIQASTLQQPKMQQQNFSQVNNPPVQQHKIQASTDQQSFAATPQQADDKSVKPKPRRSTRSGNERIPKLSVTGIEHGTVINCHMENKQKTITFKFDIRDVNPVDVASKLVRIFNQSFSGV